MCAAAWRRRYALITPMLILPIVGLLVANMNAKYYTAHTSLLIQETANMNPFLQDFAVSAMLKERVATIKTLLHSRHILAKVAEQQGLIDANTDSDQRDRVVNRLSSALKVTMPGKDLIRIDYKSDRADNMKQTLENVSEHFIEQLLAPERSSMKGSTKFLQQQLEQRRADLETAEQNLADFKDRYVTDLPELHSINITRFNGDLALLRARYTDRHSKIQAILRKLRSLEAERQNNLANNSQSLDTNKLWQIANNVNNADGEPKQQPLLISQLESLQTSRNNVQGLEEEIKSLQVMIAELENNLSGYGNLERTLIKLERDLDVKRELYDELLKRYEMARITGSLSLFEQSKRVKVIDKPYTPMSPSNFPALIFVLAGLVGGAFLGVGLVIILEFLDTSVRYRSQLENITGTAVFGRIPVY
jgi:uncharacterized protein involved in exopolysaccharide biosynthesis